MRTFVKWLRDCAPLWRLWLLPCATVALTVPLVIYLPLIQKQLIDDVMIARRLDLLLPKMLLFAAIWLGIPALQTVGTVVRAYLDERLAIYWRTRLFTHCETLSVPFWHQEHTGRTMSLFSSDVPTVTGFAGSGLVLWFANLLTIVAGAVVMFSLSWQLALIVLVVPPLIGVAASLASRPLRRISRQVQDKAAEVSERLLEGLSGLREIAAFGQERLQQERYGAIQRELLDLRMRLAYVGALIGAGQSVFSLVATATLVGVGGYLVIAGQTTVGTVLAMQQLYGQVFPTAVSFAGSFIGVQRVLASIDRINDFLDQRPRVHESPTAQWPGRLSGSVAFDRVSFAYTPERAVLTDVSFSVDPGEMVAIVGPSGAGKSSLAGLVSRFYDPDAGRVFVDGLDLRELSLTGLRAQIGIVFQDPFLFAATVRENVALGRAGATDDEVVAAIRAANAWEFVEKLPRGLDTYVGQRAVQLSEGQKQRLAIARALLRNPRILILDEPTSALDARSEYLLQGALANLMRDRTTFVIAHRLATVQRADRIFVLEDGRIVEQGTHAQLLARRGLYHELHNLQFARPAPLETAPGILAETEAAVPAGLRTG